MELNPAVSVIMSVYKEPIDWLRQSIESILCQTYRDFEFIIICDNPQYSDGIRLLKDYSEKDNRIRLIFNDNNIGLTKSLNKGLAVACGKYIARMDADDISLPERFQKQYEYLEQNQNVIVLGSSISYIGKGSLFKRTCIQYDNDSIKAQLLFENCIAHSSVFIRKSVLDFYGITYDENYRHSQDYRMWEVLYSYGDFINLREPLLKYRLSSQQITNSKSKGQQSLADSVRLRLQKGWLDRLGYEYSINDIMNDSFKIIDQLHTNRETIDSLAFKLFVRNTYLNHSCRHRLLRLFSYDCRYLSALDLIKMTKYVF